MKVTMKQMPGGEDEIIIHYRKMTSEIEQIISFIEREKSRLTGWLDKKQIVIKPKDVFYIESVDRKTFACTRDEVYRLDSTLNEVELLLAEEDFFRCSKSMVINMTHLEHLESLSYNRIDATMENGEHVMISRKYAPALRKLLRGGSSHD